MSKPKLYYILVFTGCLIFLFSLTFDWFYQGSPGVGFQQFVGMTVGFIIILMGLRYLLFTDDPKWDWLLFVMYLSGIFIVGLWPAESSHINRNILLGIDTLGKTDLALNVAGFIPLGFLVIPLVKKSSNVNKTMKLVAVALILGFTVSLIIESLQYFWVPGRYSSANDLTANTIGSMIGALCYVYFRLRGVIPRKV